MKYKFFYLIVSSLLICNFANAQAVITDYMSMENGNNGDPVTPAIAAASAQGTSGTWTEGANRPSSSATQLRVSTAHLRPPRGDIKIGSTVLPNPGSTKSYVKKVTNETDQDYVDYVFKNPRPLKVSAGMFMYFSSSGDGWNGSTFRYYDLFGLTGNGGVNYLVLSVQTSGGNDSTPIKFTIHTDVPPCNSGVQVIQASVDKWYWITMLYDYSGSNTNALMEIYDANTWEKLGSGQCVLPTVASAAEGLWRVSVGQFDNHGNPTSNSDYYMDDLMIDVNGNFPILPKTGTAPSPPSFPSNLKAQ